MNVLAGSAETRVSLRSGTIRAFSVSSIPSTLSGSSATHNSPSYFLVKK
jgi:hypothetical protein